MDSLLTVPIITGTCGAVLPDMAASSGAIGSSSSLMIGVHGMNS